MDIGQSSLQGMAAIDDDLTKRLLSTLSGAGTVLGNIEIKKLQSQKANGQDGRPSLVGVARSEAS